MEYSNILPQYNRTERSTPLLLDHHPVFTTVLKPNVRYTNNGKKESGMIMKMKKSDIKLYQIKRYMEFELIIKNYTTGIAFKINKIIQKKSDKYHFYFTVNEVASYNLVPDSLYMVKLTYLRRIKPEVINHIYKEKRLMNLNGIRNSI